MSTSMKIEEEAPKVIIEKQGIVSILGSDSDEMNKSTSLRRTLSADMSSKKWLAQNGFNSYPMKKIASSEQLATISADADHSSSSSEEEYEGKNHHHDEHKIRPGQDEVWRSIQSQKAKNEPEVWSWSSILAQKNEDSSKLPPPYIHPLVRRSGSSLSEKSLEICTENLGSETGSDGFPSYPHSEVDEENEEDQEHQVELPQPFEEDMRIVKYNYSSSRKMGQRSLNFPPPLPSLAREDGASLHMQSHRQNGRLVLEAVSIPPQNYFHAQREDGRLRLTFVNKSSSQDETQEGMEDEFEEFGRVFDDFEDIEKNDEAKFDDPGDNGYEEEEEEVENENFEIEKERREVEFVMEHNSKLMMNKNLAWSLRFNKEVNLLGVEEEEFEVEDDIRPPLPQSLPPLARVARLISSPQAASFNAYEYFWREKPTMARIIKPTISTENCTQPLKNNQNNKVIVASNLKAFGHQNLVVMSGNKADCLLPSLRTCKDSRRSLMLWEPYCIAT